MKNEVIVVVTPQQWTHPLSGNAKDYAYEFAVENQVVYVNLPLDINTLISKSRSKEDQLRIDALNDKAARTQQVQPNLWVVYPATVLLSFNFINNRFLFKLLNRINNFLFARSIKQALRSLNLKATVLFNDNLMTKGLYLQEHLKPAKKIYYVRDNFEKHTYYRSNNLKDQRELMAKSDVVFANSDFLYKIALASNPRSYNIGQGIKLTQGNSFKLPPGLNILESPIIGYLGNITSLRLDATLIEAIANRFPACTILMVGPVDKNFPAASLIQYPNIFFTGPCSKDDVSSVMELFNVAINPQLLNEMTIGNYPRKIDEYLLVGKPVVATKTDTMEMFSDLVYLATDNDSFCEAIGVALKENDETLVERRKAFAGQHTWNASKLRMYKLVEELDIN